MFKNMFLMFFAVVRFFGERSSSSVIDKAIDQWRPRLRACVRASGQHFEQLNNKNNCLSNERFCFLQENFFVRTSNLKANIHTVPFQSDKKATSTFAR